MKANILGTVPSASNVEGLFVFARCRHATDVSSRYTSVVEYTREATDNLKLIRRTFVNNLLI